MTTEIVVEPAGIVVIAAVICAVLGYADVALLLGGIALGLILAQHI